VLAVPLSASAATYTWDGGGSDSNWSTAENWNPNGVPASTGAVLFDGTSTDNVTIDTNIRVLSITITSDYTGTITQSGAVMVGTGGLVLGGGTFNGGSAPILVHSDFTLSGGTFRATSGILSILGNFIRTGGTFDANGGTVSLASPSARTLNADVTFNRLEVESTKEDGLLAYWKLDETSIPTFFCSAAGLGCGYNYVDHPEYGQYRTAYDSSGNGFDASAPGAWTASTNWPIHDSDGAPVAFANPGGMKFKRSQSWVGVYEDQGLEIPASATIAFWWKDPNTSLIRIPMASVPTSSAWAFYIGDGNISVGGTACTTDVVSASFMEDGGWHHLAIVKNEATCTLYVDGAVAKVGTGGATAKMGSGVLIGNYPNFDVLGTDGSMDDVRIYSRALTAAQVSDLANGLYAVRTGGSTLTLATNIVTTALKVWNGTLAFGGNVISVLSSIVNYGLYSFGGGSIASSAPTLTASTAVTIGSPISYTLTAAHLNTNGTARETVSLSAYGETITLTETTASSGVFTGSLPTAHSENIQGNGILESNDSCGLTVTASYGTATASTIVNDPAVPCELPGSGGGGGGSGGARANTQRQNVLPTSVIVPPNPDATHTPPSDGNTEHSLDSSSFLKITVEGKSLVVRDVPVRAWYATFVGQLVNDGIAEGYRDAEGNLTGLFGPANPVTLAELLKMALLSAGKTGQEGAPLNVSAQNDWSAPFVKAAESLKLSVFVTSLSVQAPATRGQVIQTILEAFGVAISPGNNPFSDVPLTSPYLHAIETAAALGIVTGDTDAAGMPSGTFRPDEPINRAEVAKMIVLAHKLLAH
jgi:hypothetical protein